MMLLPAPPKDRRAPPAGRGFRSRGPFALRRPTEFLINTHAATTTYHSILYRSVTQFSLETAGSFDADPELKIWVSGGGLPFTKELKRGTDVVGLQQYLAFCVFGGSIKG